MAIVTGDRYLESLVKFVEENTGPLIDGTLVLKLNPVGLHYVVSRLEALNELERLIARAPVDYLRAYVFDLGDHRALEQLRRILCRLTSLKVVSVLPPPTRDPTPLSLLPFGRLRVLELRGCDLSTSAAKGLLELRLCLEKIICHNSTDALRHVFASRIADIKKSHQWSRLSFVSCACNGLILMDESLQLLPALETLDLSRNKFSKVDNLRKCSKLAHLDLGFNQLRSIASLSEVASHIRKLVLRNNALTTLRGIENLKTIEGLDLSYNIISSFSELEVLSSLPSLKNLWLEGNPLFSARWYRPQVFSFFAHPHQLKLDNKEISTREFWKRGIIIARKLKRPASYGFYFPARENTEEDGFPNTKRKKLSRLACIESEECDVNILSEQDSVTCDYEVPSGDEIVASDEESEITSLINKIELMKKERSKLWLQDFKNWTDQGSFVNVVDGSKQQGWELCHRGEKYLANKSSWRHIGESANYAPDSIKADNDEWSTTGLASNSSFAETTLEFRQGAIPEESQFASTNLPLNHDYSKLYLERGEYNTMIAGKSNNRILTVPRGDDASTSVDRTASVVNIDTVEALLFSAFPVSPPHYQEDILHRRHYLEEEFLQLSAESLSLASSDSNTSMEEDKVCETETLQVDKSFNGESLSNGISWCSASASAEDGDDVMDEVHHVTQICQLSHELYAGQAKTELIIPGQSSGLCYDDDVCVGVGNDNNYRRDGLNMNKCIRKPKKRVVSLSDENSMSSLNQIVNELEPLQHSKVNTVFSGEDRKAEEKEHTVDKNDSFRKECDNTDTPSVMMLPPMDENGRSLVPGNDSAQQPGSWVENYFNSVVADPRVHETCRQYFICSSFFDHEMRCEEREVAVLVSSESKLYVLLTDIRVNGSGNGPILSSHKLEDVTSVFVGLGLQLIWVYIDGKFTYLFITKSTEKSRQLLCMLEVLLQGSSSKCCLQSLEKVQVELFDKHICGGSNSCIYQYSLVLFLHKNNQGEQWVSRSLFVSGGCLFVCIEDVLQLSSHSLDADSAPYFLLDSRCSVANVSEMVIEAKESKCVRLTVGPCASVHCLSAITDMVRIHGKSVPSVTWSLKWPSIESLLKFVTLLKAIHASKSSSSLSITYIS